jgi:uncharacterized membrane protein
MVDVPQWFQVFFFSMFPWLEARYVIPLAMLHYHWEWWQALPVAVAGNILPIPFILVFFKYVEEYLRRFPRWASLMDALFSRTRHRAEKKIQQSKYLGLFLFVAIPVPFTGAWTGALISYLFGLKRTWSLVVIFLGLVTAAVIMILLTLYLTQALGALGIHL